MKDQEYVVTGVNRLTGYREEITRGMSYEEAQERLEREMQSRRYQRYMPHKCLRVEKRLPVQLTLQFHE